MKRFVRSVLLPSLVILIGGVLLVALSWLLYFGIYMFVETQFFRNDPQSVPADQIRTYAAVALCILYLAVLRTKWPDLVKAAILVAPLTMILITVVLDFYMRPLVAVPVFLAIVGIGIFLVVRFRRPWPYYLATALSIVIALLYAWPE